MISVIMATYNESINDIKESVYSVLIQTYSNYELVIIDDNPKSKAIKDFLLYLSNVYRQIKVLFNKKNMGRVFSRNKAIKYSDGDIIAILDSDDVWLPNKLTIQLEFMKRYNLDFVFSNINYIGDRAMSNEPMYNFNSIVNSFKLKLYLLYYDNIAPHSTWLVKRNVYKHLNGYRNLIVEDFDFILRALNSGYHLGYIDKVLCHIRLRFDDVMSCHILLIYLTEKKLRHFFKFNINNKKNVMPLHILKDESCLNNDILRDFNKFLIIKDNLENDFTFNNLFKLLFSFFNYKYSFSFTLHLIFNKIKNLIFNLR